MKRPVLIDEQDGKCEICAEWQALNSSENKTRYCVTCKEPVSSLTEMQGNGYQSPRPNHFHLKATLGLNGREAIFSEHCYGCYCALYKEVYNKPYPPAVSELSPTFV